jgi:hypothetical protein
MCVVIGKYFENLGNNQGGWVGMKNRDRNYVPDISFKKINANGMEILYFWDDITQYCEGFNESGIAIISSALLVTDDEKEITVRSKTPSKDGIKIKKALTYSTIKEVAMSLIKQKLTGHTLIFNEDTMMVLEGSWKKGEYKKQGYEYEITKIPKDQIVVRTNHGIDIKWAGYQRTEDDNQSMSRVSSESRKLIGEYVATNATTPRELMDNMTKDYTGNPQLNALRVETDDKKMRTTSQIMIIPSERTMYIRPVQSNMNFNFWELNQPNQHTWVEIVSNRVLYQNVGTNRDASKMTDL